MAEMASGWHIARFLEAITAYCSNFVGKIGRGKVTKLTIMVVSLLTLTEIVFETKTLVDAIKRRNVLPDNDSLTDLDDQQCSFGGYDDSLRGYVTLTYLAMWQRFFISLCGFTFSTINTIHQNLCIRCRS